MECVQKQQTIPLAEISAPRNTRIRIASKQVDTYDEEAAKFRRYLASEEAMRQLENRRTLSTISAHRLSFIR